jgi:tRNA dimethylallyltransferase
MGVLFWCNLTAKKWSLGLDEIHKIIVVAGPTGSGKSSLALRLARALNGELINADSVQFYKGLDIGSAKLLDSELQGVKQHLVDICEPDRPIDVATFVKLADQAISQVTARSRLPIVVGGSSLYLKALLHGLADLPPADSKLREVLEARSSVDLYQQLQQEDPKRAAQLHHNDRLRVIRALETCALKLASRGSAASDAHSAHSFSEVRYQALILCLLPDRQELYERINRRTLVMLKAGFVAEVQSLVSLYGSGIRPLESVGYRQVLEALKVEGANTEQLAYNPGLAAAISQATRNYAKQQYTFWRNEPKKRDWCEKLESFDVDPTSKAMDACESFRVLPLAKGVLLIKLQSSYLGG